MERDLVEDIRKDPELMVKIKEDRYAQNVYAALCNMRWQPEELWPVLKDEYWTCSWRAAGGIVAGLRVDSAEDYLNWYCSGMGTGLGNGDEFGDRGYVPEGIVTEEIRADFARLGWHPSEWPDN